MHMHNDFHHNEPHMDIHPRRSLKGHLNTFEGDLMDNHHHHIPTGHPHDMYSKYEHLNGHHPIEELADPYHPYNKPVIHPEHFENQFQIHCKIHYLDLGIKSKKIC